MRGGGDPESETMEDDDLQWTTTVEGERLLKSKEGEEWLKTENGQEWLELLGVWKLPYEGRDGLETPPGTWLDTDEGKNWLVERWVTKGGKVRRF